MNRLPEPEPAARAHSQRLQTLIRAEIERESGIPFSRFMELALYAPGLGYYSAGAHKFGSAGDFVTAPELGPLFARCIGNAIAPMLSALGPDARVLEPGAGSGALVCDLLAWLHALGATPAHYDILEPSADLRQRQQQRVHEQLPAELAARVRWLDAPLDCPWDGVLIANEVIDALPASRFIIDGSEVLEEYVVLAADGCLVSAARPADAMLQRAVRHVESELPDPFVSGYRSEILPQLPWWIAALAGGMRRGALLFIDYGYPRCEFYQPERRHGTLICHYRQQAHADPFHLPGLQDLSAFVDFTALAEAGTAAGFDFAGYCSQASFLLGNGLTDLLAAAATLPERDRHRMNLAAKRLTLPGEMGERFQVMGFSRDLEIEAAFGVGDLSHRL